MEYKSVIFFLLLAGLTVCYGDIVEEMSSNRILDGNVADEGQFPYAISIQLLGAGQAQETRGHRCGGALISLSNAVTVASCFFEIINGVPQIQNPAQYRVFAGGASLTNDTSADRVRALQNFTVHPEYTGPPALVNNIAVLFLASAFPANVVTPIALPNANFAPVDFTTCTVVGWGGNAPGESGSIQLRFANKYIYNQNLCMSIYNSLPNVKNILPSMVCAVSLDLLSSNCLGDEGNALVCGGTFTGLLSLSDGCTRSTLPEVYTRVSNQTRWIRTVSGSPTIYAPSIVVITMLFSLLQMFLKH